MLYPGGDHHVLKEGKPSHRLDGVRRIVDWVQRWVEVPLPRDGEGVGDPRRPAQRPARPRGRDRAPH